MSLNESALKVIFNEWQKTSDHSMMRLSNIMETGLKRADNMLAYFASRITYGRE